MSTCALILIVDDDQDVRVTLRVIVETAGHRAKEYASAQACLDDDPAAAQCILSDVRMPGMGGLEFLGALQTRGIAAPVVLLTGHSDVQLAVRAMKTGAVDFIEKPFEVRTLLDTIEAALREGEQLVRLVTEARSAQDRLRLLTPREREVLDLLAAGQSHKMAARALGISYRTIEVHRAHIMVKLVAEGLPDLVRIVLAASQCPDPPPTVSYLRGGAIYPQAQRRDFMGSDRI